MGFNSGFKGLICVTGYCHDRKGQNCITVIGQEMGHACRIYCERYLNGIIMKHQGKGNRRKAFFTLKINSVAEHSSGENGLAVFKFEVKVQVKLSVLTV